MKEDRKTRTRTKSGGIIE